MADDKSFADRVTGPLKNAGEAMKNAGAKAAENSQAINLKVLDQAERMAVQIDGDRLRYALAIRDGYRALAKGDYDAAAKAFAVERFRSVRGWREESVTKLLWDRAAAQAAGDAAAFTKYDAALRELSLPIS